MGILNMEETDLLKLITLITFKKFNDKIFEGISTKEIEGILPHIEFSVINFLVKKNDLHINRTISYPLRVLEVLGYVNISFRGKKKYVILTDKGKDYFKGER